MKIYEAGSAELSEFLNAFERNEEAQDKVTEIVAGVIAQVRQGGDQAIFQYTAQFDGAQINTEDFRVTEAELQAGYDSLSEDDLAHIQKAKTQVEWFHKITKPENWGHTNQDGADIGERFYPIQSVGIYIPGGRVPLVSSVIMSVALAKIAGNPRIVVATPPLADGSISPGMLAALKICGADEIYKMGGSQAIAAMAYGTETVKPVDKIFGPGNAYVLEAKRQVFGKVGIDLLPGPSEVAILADETANPEWVAADLLAQAEHGTGKERVFLVASSEEIIRQVEAAIVNQLPKLSHSDAIANVMDKGYVRITFNELSDAIDVLNQIAPEHFELQVKDEWFDEVQQGVTTAGAMLLGHHSPTVLGDFTAGPSHTLPTGGAGRFLSGLRITDFLRRTSVVKYTADNLPNARDVVRTFSRLEQLDAHGNSLEVRFGDKK